MRKYFGYCRVSTENQRDDKTIGLQQEALTLYSQNNKLEIVTVFKDEGISGGLQNRPELMELLHNLENSPEIEGVLIYKLDRLARDVVIQENLIKEFQKLGKRVISTVEPDLDSNDPTRKLVRQILGVISEYEKSMITMRLSGGRFSKARKGGYAGGRVPLGYKVNKTTHSLVPDKLEAKTVRMIKYLKRYKKLSFGKIAKLLNEEGVPTKRGGKWNAYTVWYILNNPIYHGVIHYGRIKEKSQHQALL